MYRLALSFLCLSLITGCAPSFKVESNYNEFRNTSTCKMENNFIRQQQHNVKGFLLFNLKKDTELSPPYILEIENIQSDDYIAFKKDSYLRLTLTQPNGVTELLVIQAIFSKVYCDTNIYGNIYNSCGSISQKKDYLSCVFFSLTQEQIDQILSATEISFDLETTEQPLRATLLKENIQNLQEFRESLRCLP